MPDPMNAIGELEPCPFCGGKAHAGGNITYSERHDAWWPDGTRVREAFFVNCVSCSADNKGFIGHQTREQAIAAWNRRALSKTEAHVEITHEDACRYADTSSDPLATMLRAAWEKLQAGDSFGAEVHLHAARLAQAHQALSKAEAHVEGEEAGCRCGACGGRYRVDVLVPDALWTKINADGPEMLCGPCILRRIEALGRFDVFSLSRSLPSKEEVARIIEDAIQQDGEVVARDCSTSRNIALEKAEAILSLFSGGKGDLGSSQDLSPSTSGPLPAANPQAAVPSDGASIEACIADIQEQQRAHSAGGERR